MSCCSAPGVVFISLWQISECTSPSNPLLSHCSFSLSHSVLECLQKASLLEHSFPDLNPTSDCFILHEYWNSPLFQLICLYKLAKTSDETSLRISVLFPHVIFRLHFKNYLYLISSRMTSLMTRDFFILVLVLILFPQKLDVPLKWKVECLFDHLFLTLVFPNASPFWLRDPWMLLLLCPLPSCPLSPRNILPGCIHDFILVTLI